MRTMRRTPPAMRVVRIVLVLWVRQLIQLGAVKQDGLEGRHVIEPVSRREAQIALDLALTLPLA